MAAKYYDAKTKKIFHKNAKTVKIFLKNKKAKNASMPVIDTESFLEIMNFVKKKETVNFNMHAIYIIIFLKKKKRQKF